MRIIRPKTCLQFTEVGDINEIVVDRDAIGFNPIVEVTEAALEYTANHRNAVSEIIFYF